MVFLTLYSGGVAAPLSSSLSFIIYIIIIIVFTSFDISPLVFSVFRFFYFRYRKKKEEFFTLPSTMYLSYAIAATLIRAAGGGAAANIF